MNPVGCPGLQSGTLKASCFNLLGSNTRKKWTKAKIYAVRFVIFLLILLLIALSPLGILLTGLLWPSAIYEGRTDSCCKMISIRMLLLLAGLVTMPITIPLGILLAIVPGSCILMVDLIRKCKKKSERKRRRREIIRKRREREEKMYNPPSLDDIQVIN